MRVVPRRSKNREDAGPADEASPPDEAPAAPGAEERSPAGAPAPAPPPVPPPDDEAARRRARAARRQRTAAEVKRSRAGLREERARRAGRTRAEAERRSALLVMVLALGLLIATVAVTGAMFAAVRHTRPITLGTPLHVYPVAAATPGACAAGTRGVTGQTATGPVCYGLTQGIAIRRVSDLRVQRSRSGGGYDVAVTLRPSDKKAFAALTRATLGRNLAFVVGPRLVTVPRVDTAITDGRIVIVGTPTRAGADQIVAQLKGR
ncbi:SecDF P1 head subdomain-containing protein [Actinomadura parmotrematis]|uniref:SecDF P1 head subdomain domain-containing protein n=1 Tax=Actinomadura parmotrematis TaxID=2864039 RepID=A0ABS7FXE4_9ACTN|nr:hypothetical protein [Actinomadura parmotrematis]MBW8485088.1 hypothetical protein [Actinomadura parmotrematis]